MADCPIPMRLATLACLALSALAASERPALLPLPVEIIWGTGKIAATEPRVDVRPGSVAAPTCADEAYELEVGDTGIRIRANSERGVRHARATLVQLTRGGKVARAVIRDWPAFPIRGLMHDVGRNFQSLAMVKRQVDLMARHKLNTFHWHLTDYHGWRVETRRNPGLNDPKSRERNPGGQYNWDEVRELVAFAAARGIEVIPEMDMPGHSTYFRKGLGFDMQTPEGVKVLKGEIDDWARLFPSRHFHLGSDEVAIRMKDFLPQMVGHVRQLGKTPILWKPGGGIPGDDVIYQLWAKAPPPKGNPYIDSRYVYTNHMDPSEAPNQMFIQLAGRPATDGRALGAILCHWPDHVIGDEALTNRISPTWPVALAFAESAWRGVGKDRRDLYARAPRPDEPERAAYLDLESRLAAQRPVVLAAGEPFPFLRSAHIPWRVVTTGPDIGQPRDWSGATEAWGGTLYLNHHWHELPSWLPLAKAPSVAWARTYIHSAREREVGLAIGFNGPSSSDTPRPEHRFVNGEWNPPGSEVRLNGAAIPGPDKWDMASLSNKEQTAVPWTDASWFNRPPQKVRLKAGWNEVLVRTPSHLDGKRLRKWMLTVIPCDWDPATASLVEVDGLRFSAEPR